MTGKICDFTGSAKDVQTYHVCVQSEDGTIVCQKQRDYGKRGLARLLNCIERGTAKAEGKTDAK